VPTSRSSDDNTGGDRSFEIHADDPSHGAKLFSLTVDSHPTPFRGHSIMARLVFLHLHFPRAPFREHFSFPLPLYDHSNDLGPCCFSNPWTPQLSQLLSLQRYWALLRNLHATHMSSPWRYNAPRFELLATPTLRFNSLTRLFYILLLTLFLSPPMIDVAVEISYSSQQTKVD